MKKLFRSKWIYVVAIVLTVLFFRYCSVKGYIQKVTHIDLPFWTETIETADNYEFESEAKFVIPESTIGSFITENKLQKIHTSSYYFFDAFLLSEESQPTVDSSGSFHYAEDCRGHNTWRILLNSETGELWIIVEYPDMAGDYRPCDK